MLNGHQNGDFPPARFVNSGTGVKQSVQAAWLQRFCFDAAVALRKACSEKEGKLIMDNKTAMAVQKLCVAWDTIADRRRVLKGKGLPAAVRSKPKQERPLEPL